MHGAALRKTDDHSEGSVVVVPEKRAPSPGYVRVFVINAWVDTPQVHDFPSRNLSFCFIGRGFPSNRNDGMLLVQIRAYDFVGTELFPKVYNKHGRKLRGEKNKHKHIVF